jgi:LPXTG-motif cell wall-anchored protein
MKETCTCHLPACPVCPGAGSTAPAPAPGSVAAVQTTAAGPALPETGFPAAVLALVAGSCMVLIGAGWYVRRWWIRRQNPVLFEDF